MRLFGPPFVRSVDIFSFKNRTPKDVKNSLFKKNMSQNVHADHATFSDPLIRVYILKSARPFPLFFILRKFQQALWKKPQVPLHYKYERMSFNSWGGQKLWEKWMFDHF